MSKEFPITVSSWTLGDQCKFEERVKAAKEAGYDGIGLRAETYVDALNEGLHDEDILAILEKYDMKVTEVEYIVQWAEDARSYEQKYKEQMCFHMCELFNVGHINCGLMEDYSVEHTAQKLKELCQRAGKLVIGVEPMPYSGIPNMEKGWAVVKESGCDRPYAKSILRDESMHDRLAPGTGIGCTADFVKMVREKGIEPKAIGVEVISDAILAKGVAEAAKHTFDNTKKVLEQVWPEVL